MNEKYLCGLRTGPWSGVQSELVIAFALIPFYSVRQSQLGQIGRCLSQGNQPTKLKSSEFLLFKANGNLFWLCGLGLFHWI